jgi:WD40 repeat protein
VKSNPWAQPSGSPSHDGAAASEDAPLDTSAAGDDGPAPASDGASDEPDMAPASPDAPVSCVPGSGGIRVFAFSPSGDALAVGTADGTVVVLSAEDGAIQSTWRGHADALSGLSFVRQDLLVTGALGESVVRFWDPRTGAVRLAAGGGAGSVVGLANAQDGSLLLTTTRDNAVEVSWRRHDTGELVRTFPGALGGDIAAGGEFLTTWETGRVTLWNRDGNLWWYRPGTFSRSAVSADGKRVLLVEADALELFRPNDNLQAWRVPASSTVNAVTFSPSGEEILVADGSGVKILAASDGSLQATLVDQADTGAIRLAASADGRFIAGLGTDGKLAMWLSANAGANAARVSPSWRRGDFCSPVAPRLLPAIGTGLTARGACQSPALTDDELYRFGVQTAHRVSRLARLALVSPALQQCLQQVMTGGDVTMPHEAEPSGWGGYCPAGTEACGGAGPADPYRLLTGHLGDQRRREVCARRLASHLSVIGGGSLSLECAPDATEPDHSGAGQQDAIKLRAPPARFRAALGQGKEAHRARVDLAADLVHVAMHNHGFQHASGQAEAFRKRQVPDIAAACVREVLLQLELGDDDAPASAACGPCSDGKTPVAAKFRGNTCLCVHDPAEPFPMPAKPVQRWAGSPGSLATVKADNDGGVYMTLVPRGQVSEWTGEAWRDLGVQGDIESGGDVLLVWSGDKLFRRNKGGPFVPIGAPGDEHVVDDLGTVYRRTGRTIQQLLLDTTTWTDVPLPADMLTEWLLVGGGELYATTAENGWLFHYARTGPASGSWQRVPGLAAWYDVDAIGRVFGVPRGGGPLYLLGEGSQWDIIAGSTEQVMVGQRAFHRGVKSDRIGRMYPSGEIRFVTSCTHWTVGASVLYCVLDRGVDVFDMN